MNFVESRRLTLWWGCIGILQGAPNTVEEANIPSMKLPRCQKCNGLLRPHVVWFGECLERDVVNRTDDALQGCDLLLVVGTSAVVYVSPSSIAKCQFYYYRLSTVCLTPK